MKILSLLFTLSLSFNQASGATFVDTITKSFGKTSGCSSDQTVKYSDKQTKKNKLTFKGSNKKKVIDN
ncbi:MAG: hypothetical protein CMP43_03985 [Rickettsiales bacterium]|nr:hypothetical protein [Rickettsiales bacterium]|tara:strand:- start:202 stop:405 length:204 start_codon:yes stop_codon:yes gene_type:complete